MSDERAATPHTQTLRLRPGADFIPPPTPARILAYLLDLVASVVITFSLHRGVMILFAGPLAQGDFLVRTLALSVWFIGGLGYWVVIPLASGSTPGKMLFHMRVVPERDRPVGVEQVILREVIGHALGFATLGIGFLMATRDARARTLQDRLAGTRLVQFTRPRPDLYQVTDLRTADEEGTLHTDLLPADQTPPSRQTPSEQGPASRPSGARPMPHIGDPSTSGSARTLYRRPEGETAYERKQRAAKGPTVDTLAEALRNTARLVDSAQLMPKVLERKREEFIEALRTADLGPDPREAVQTVVALGREDLLDRDELSRIRDILQERMKP